MSTNFTKTLVWKQDYDVILWRHKQRTPNTNDYPMPLNETSPWKVSAYATVCVTPQRIVYYPCGVIYTQFGNHWFNVKLAFFTVFVLTLQTGFAARWCYWFSANDSTNEQVCSPLVYTMCKETWVKKKHCCQSAFFATNALSKGAHAQNHQTICAKSHLA